MEIWLSQLLQTYDSMFPTGAYAHSFGLEGAVQAGFVFDPNSFDSFLGERIVPALENLELPTVAHAYRLAGAGELDCLYDLDQQYGAMKGARELREVSVNVGTQRLSLMRKLNPHPFWENLEMARRESRLNAHEPIVLGTQAALSCMPLDATLTAVYYQGLAVQINAALKLIRIGQMSCQTLLGKHLGRVREVVTSAKKVDIDRIGWFSPTVDIASALHETAYTRIFIS